jgi:hypothetical protein
MSKRMAARAVGLREADAVLRFGIISSCAATALSMCKAVVSSESLEADRFQIAFMFCPPHHYVIFQISDSDPLSNGGRGAIS